MLTLEPPAESGLNAAEQRFAADLALIVKLLQGHMTANAGYSESLARANADLPQLSTPDEIRAVVLTLIEENRKIQTKMDELSASLDEFGQQDREAALQSRRGQRQGDARFADRTRQPAFLRRGTRTRR